MHGVLCCDRSGNADGDFGIEGSDGSLHICQPTRNLFLGFALQAAIMGF